MKTSLSACLLLMSALNAAPLACEGLVGTWEGTYHYPSNGMTGPYRVTFRGDHSSAEVITMKAKNGSQTDHRQKGTWHCEGTNLTISVTTVTGAKASNRYRILELTPEHQKYRYEFKGKAGPVFDLARVR